MGYLRPFEVIAELNSKFGVEIKSTQALNRLLNDMGIIVKEYGYWKLTDLGKKYAIFEHAIRQDCWRPEIVRAVAEYLMHKG